MCIRDRLSRAELAPLEPKEGTLNLSDTVDFIDRTTQSLDKLSSHISQDRDLIDSDDKILTQIAPMLGLKIPLSKIFSLEYIKFRFGKLPRDSYEKVMIGREGQQFIYMPSSIEEEYVWGIYFAPRGAIERVDATFASLHFERIWISKMCIRDSLRLSRHQQIDLEQHPHPRPYVPLDPSERLKMPLHQQFQPVHIVPVTA